ncbi:DUF6134 family protein [Aestuariibaculum sediminum]|uniref:Uncharacterized protein n=1 Tax=Aestuariibaculum sediminum TaxID=2770637 RepID=A0A8J6Q892_9FLAO|nr:DUF6134 family protein [Aestuariibaculum sediminum]MBD0832460.1 hypothetical protein [Aestuariibaculum sediminum]
MIPALILYLIRRMKYGSDASNDFEKIREIILKIKSVLFFFIVSSACAINTISKTEILTYKVVKNNTTIGYIHIEKHVNQDVITYDLKSNVEVKLLVKVSVSSSEKSVYKDGVLLYSSVYRKINGKVKANHKVIRETEQYAVIDNNEKKFIELSKLSKGLVALYFEEPKEVRKVYCDNLKQAVSVTPVRVGCYRVDFERGKYNVFHYKNGECIKIEAISNMFKVTLIPVLS